MQEQAPDFRLRQLRALLSHAARHSPYYREQPWAARLRAGQAIAFRDLPVTEKALVRRATTSFYADRVPPEHGKILVKHTSGSSGEPMALRKTMRHFRVNYAENRRLMREWDVNGHGRVAEIKFPDEDYPLGVRRERALRTGMTKWEYSTLDSDEGLAFLLEVRPTLLNAYPSIAQAILERSIETSRPLRGLALIVTISEVVSDELRGLVRRMPGCRLADRYGSVEAGLIAVQCPRCCDYHPAERHLVLEILTDDGSPAPPGGMGRVVVTPLFNFAMPLVRYETGDYAVPGTSGGCPSGRRPITRIIGRESGLFKLPGGGKLAAMLPAGVAAELGVRQYKLFQTGLREVELHYVPRPGGSGIDDARAQAIVDRYLSTLFRVRCRAVAEIPRAPSGKYIMHESLI